MSHSSSSTLFCSIQNLEQVRFASCSPLIFSLILLFTYIYSHSLRYSSVCHPSVHHPIYQPAAHNSITNLTQIINSTTSPPSFAPKSCP